MPGYRLVLAPRIADRIRRLPPDLKRGIRQALSAIRENPARGEPLKQELRGYWKYRVRRFRIAYRVDRDARIIRVMAVGHRRVVYEELAAAVRRREAAE